MKWIVVANVMALACACVRVHPPDWSVLVRQALERSLDEHDTMRAAIHGGVLIATTRGCGQEIRDGAVLQHAELLQVVGGIPVKKLESMPEEEWVGDRPFTFLRVCALTTKVQPNVFVILYTYLPLKYGEAVDRFRITYGFRRSWGKWRIAFAKPWYG